MLLRKLPLRNRRKQKQAAEPPLFHDQDRTGSLIVSSGSRLALHQLVDPVTNNPVDIPMPGVGTLLRSASVDESKEKFQVHLPSRDSLDEAGPVVTVSFALHRAHPAKRPPAKLPSFNEDDSAFSSSCDTDSDCDCDTDSESDYAELRQSSEGKKPTGPTVQYEVASSKKADVVYYEVASANTLSPQKESPVYAEVMPLSSRPTSPEKTPPNLPPRIAVRESDEGSYAVINNAVDYRQASRHTTAADLLYEEPEKYFPEYSSLQSPVCQPSNKSSPGYSQLANSKHHHLDVVDEGYAVLYPVKKSASIQHVYSCLSPAPCDEDNASSEEEEEEDEEEFQESTASAVQVVGRNPESIQRVAQRWRISDRDAAEIMQAFEDANSSTEGF